MIHTFTFKPVFSKMYLIQEGNSALIVDPCVSEEAKEYLVGNQVKNIMVILTHEHYDHISGVNWLRECFEKVTVLCSEICALRCSKPGRNLSSFTDILFSQKENEDVSRYRVEPYSCTADQTFSKMHDIMWEGHQLQLWETPGHSKGSICILFDNKILFSGDTLVTGYDTVTKLPGGSKKEFEEISIPFLRTLDGELMVYPGHGRPQLLKEYPCYIAESNN